MLADDERVVFECWRLTASGREEDARQRLLLVWQHYMDSGAQPRLASLSHRLLCRLGFSTDDPAEWGLVSDPMTLYRSGPPGSSWSLDRDFVEHWADGDEIREASVPKREAIAYIAGRGESEVVLRDPR
jgi:hypothetical protein